MPLHRAFRAALAAGVATALLCALPAGAGAQRGRDCDKHPQQPICQQIKKRQEFNDKRQGITPACRVVANAYGDAHRRRLLVADGVKEFKAALKKSKTDKAKKKNAKGLKKYKKLLKKAKKTEAQKLAARAKGCQGSKIPA
jgi:ERCC4-related helicase